MRHTKIILFRGGFAGDLFTALHDIRCFKELTPGGKIIIDRELKLLQNKTKLSLQEKDNYYNKHRIISCCDSEFALTHHKNTLVIKCDNKLVLSFFSKRLELYHPTLFTDMTTDMTIEQYIKDVTKWHNFWPKKFKKQLDISDIFSNKKFLDKLDIPINDEKETLFQRWKVINEKNFVIHTNTSNQ